MKKLVTIVSAVMMLLMLAACAPSLNVSAEDAEQIALGNEAIAALEAYAKQEKAKLNKDDQPKGNNLALVAENDGKVTVDTVEYTIKAGSVYTYTENLDKNVGHSEPTQAETVGKKSANTPRNLGSHEVNPAAEKVVNSLANVILWIGCIIAAFMVIYGLSVSALYGFAMLGVGIVIVVSVIVQWAFLRVVVNISRNMYNINEALRQRK